MTSINERSARVLHKTRNEAEAPYVSGCIIRELQKKRNERLLKCKRMRIRTRADIYSSDDARRTFIAIVRQIASEISNFLARPELNDAYHCIAIKIY